MEQRRATDASFVLCGKQEKLVCRGRVSGPGTIMPMLPPRLNRHNYSFSGGVRQLEPIYIMYIQTSCSPRISAPVLDPTIQPVLSQYKCALSGDAGGLRCRSLGCVVFCATPQPVLLCSYFCAQCSQECLSSPPIWGVRCLHLPHQIFMQVRCGRPLLT